MLTKLEIDNFRGIQKLKLEEARRVNLIAGSNNSGKTSLLEAVFLLLAPTKPQLSVNINFFRGVGFVENYWAFMFRGLETEQKLQLFAEFTDETRTLIIKPALFSPSEIYRNNHETSNDDSTGQMIPGLDTKLQVSMNGLKYDYIQKSLNMPEKEFSSEIINTGKTFPDYHEAKGYEEFRSGIMITSQTIKDNFAERFHQAKIGERLDKVLNVIQKIEPMIKEVFLGADRLIWVRTDHGMMPLNLMGDGIIRIFNYLLTISFRNDTIILIDEIENGLHFSVQRTLWKAVIAAAHEFNVQIFATTHSDDCIKALLHETEDPDDVAFYRMSQKKDHHLAVRYSPDDLKTSFEMNLEVR